MTWNDFIRGRTNVIHNYFRARDAAIVRNDPAAVEHWKAWCYWVVEKKLLGEL